MITSTLSTLVASGVITKVCAGLFGTSAILTAAKNNAAKHKVERQGYRVHPDRRSLTERTISFIKDYFFLIVPGYNLYKSFKTFLMNDEAYAEQRKSLFEKRERLEELEPKDKTKKKAKKEKEVEEDLEEEFEEELEEELEERPVRRTVRRTDSTATRRTAPRTKESTSSRRTESTRTTTSTTPVPFAGLTREQLEDLKDHYVRIDRNLRKKYARKQAAGASVPELNAIASDTIKNKELYDLVVSRIEVLKLSELFETPSGTGRTLRK